MPHPIGRWVLLLTLITSLLIWLLTWYGSTVQTMVATWLSSETFAHGFFILPISLWLIWRRRHAIGQLSPQPNFWMLMPLAGVSFVWLLGQLASVVVVQQYALIIMMLFLIVVILGHHVAREIVFPLLFLLFAVPFGEVFLPILMQHTADFTVFALRLTGIPVYREGLYFMIPSGNWSVIEACSGLRYLIASITLGVLYAYLTYRSLRRRVIFVLLSIMVPIVANWLRAYMIVMIGHLTSMKHAAGVDHLIYGWVFFGVIMLILFWVGARWREDQIPAQAVTDAVTQSVPMRSAAWKATLTATLASAGVVVAAPAIAAKLTNAMSGQAAIQIPAESAGWRKAAGPLTTWSPQFENPSVRLAQVYANQTGQAQLFLLYYRNQRPGAQLVSSRNALVQSANPKWATTGNVQRTLNAHAVKMGVMESRLKGDDGYLLVWHWYWIDGQYTSSAYWAKLLQAKSMLLGRGDSAAAIMVATPYNLSPAEGADRLQDFVTAMLPAVGEVLQRAR